MLRLKSPAYERLFQSPLLETSFGGSEFNVLASLARFGIPAEFVTALPDHDIGRACLAEMRAHNVGTDAVRFRAGRMGQYFLEAGANHRPTNILYDRQGAAFAGLDKRDMDWKAVLQGKHWLHLSGITPALGEGLAEMSLEAVQVARDLGLTVSFDVNYRQKLWRDNSLDAPDILSRIVRHVDVLFASEEDCRLNLGIEGDGNTSDLQGRNYSLSEKMFAAYPNLQVMSTTFRESLSADHNNLSAGLRDRTGYFVSRSYEMRRIIDRIGGGDAFAAGLIYALIRNEGGQRALDFATAAACLKHSIYGDVNRVSVADVEALLQGSSGGQVSR